MSKRKIHKSKLGIIDFQKKFNTEDKCREFLFELRFPQGFVCPESGCTEFYHIKKRHTYQCKCCRHQTSVTSGTVMDKTHLKLTYWLWAMFFVCKRQTWLFGFVSVTNAETALQNGLVSSSTTQKCYVKSRK